MSSSPSTPSSDAPTHGRPRPIYTHIHDHFGTLFALLVLTFVISGFAEFHWARIVTGLLQIAMLSVAFFTTHRKGQFPLAVVLIVVAVVMMVVATVFRDADVVHGVGEFVVAGIFLVLLIAVFRRVLLQERVTVETILGALCVYFLVGLMFTAVFAGTDALSVEPIFGYEVPNEDYSYFSFITLTTVGYGDLTAVTDIARRFAVIEAMTGQIFLATAVARLVSLYGTNARSAANSEATQLAAATIARVESDAARTGVEPPPTDSTPTDPTSPDPVPADPDPTDPAPTERSDGGDGAGAPADRGDEPGEPGRR